MELKPLKRHPSLQPLSREHMSGLVQARNLQASSTRDVEERLRVVRGFIEVWRLEIHDHFEDEERLLPALIDEPAKREKLLDDHRKLRAFAQQLIDDPTGAANNNSMLEAFGTLLHDHIRWEERVLFEGIQHDHPRELEGMSDAAHEIEVRRPGAGARCRLEWEGDGREKLPPMVE